MRRKKAPVPCNHNPKLINSSPSSPPKRRRTSPSPSPPITKTAVENWHTRESQQWAHAEFFYSIIDQPFFSHSEFTRIMHSIMSIPSSSRITRIQVSRIRAAMCNAFPGQYAKPRRLSKSFIKAELDELHMYRTDARLLLRGSTNCLPIIDTFQGTQQHLPLDWSSRYCSPPPQLPNLGTIVFVRCTGAVIKRALFEGLSGDSSFIVRFLDHHATTNVVSDLDVMLFDHVGQSQQFVIPLTPTPTRNLLATPTTCNVDPNVSLLHLHHHQPFLNPITPLQQQQSPLSPRYLFSPQPTLDDPLSMDTPKFSNHTNNANNTNNNNINSNTTNNINYNSNNSNLYSSPFPFQSPLRPIRPASLGTIECEVDVRQLAESICLLDRKTELLCHLRSLNDQVQHHNVINQLESGEILPPSYSIRYESLITELALLEEDLRHVLAAQSVVISDNDNDNIVGSLNFGTPERPPQMEIEKRLSNNININNNNHHIGDIATNNTSIQQPLLHPPPLPPAPPPRIQERVVMTTLPPEHLAKNVDFRNAGGALSLAKALTRATLAQLPDNNVLKCTPTALRADLMECVSACVTVLIRARATMDFECIEQVTEAVPLRFAENLEALDAIHSAAKMFDTSSADSL